MPKRVAEGAKRVPLNCLVLPETLAWLKSLEGSQGGAIDLAVAALRMQEAQGRIPVPVAYVQSRASVDAYGPKLSDGIGKASPQTFRGPLLKPKDQK